MQRTRLMLRVVWIVLLSVSFARASPPNFIVILTDDQRFDALGVLGDPQMHTPAMDKLAQSGVRFTHGFVTLAICSPSRATVLTGRYGSVNGVTTLGQPVRKGQSTVAELLKAAGYRTGIVGKWHLGNKPQDLGFDDAQYFHSNGTYHNRHVIEDGKDALAKGYIEDWNTQQSIRFIESAKADGKPFFLWHCTQVPHMDNHFDWPASDAALAQYDADEMSLPSTWNDDLSGKPDYLKTARSRTQALEYGYDKPENIRNHMKRYRAAVTDMDQRLGALLAAVDRMGLRDNTYIFLMGDNGWMIGDHGFTSKVLAYEPSMRVPFLVAGPGIAPAVRDELVLNADIAPTILALAKLGGADDMHGTSLLPLLHNERTEWRASFYYEAPTPALGSHPLWALRTERYKYIRTLDPDHRDAPPFEELYDLHEDPNEMHNLAHDSGHAEVLRKLSAELDERRVSIK
ncbi:MAG: sulfatase-like hydrolase/transferase [Planctomycetes bacterium]|nr:sulfatase-like hydrolase/transferase [Planctomycetota bacterium]